MRNTVTLEKPSYVLIFHSRSLDITLFMYIWVPWIPNVYAIRSSNNPSLDNVALNAT